MGYWTPSAREIRAFQDWKPRFTEISGPRSLWHFTNARSLSGDSNTATWWMDKSVVTSAAQRSQTAGSADFVFEYIRDAIALREDWGNQLLYAFEMIIPETYRGIHGWVGRAKAQQAHIQARALQERIHRGDKIIFEGGATQYLIRHASPHVRRLISPPITTRKT